jgi:hypothetical protein
MDRLPRWVAHIPPYDGDKPRTLGPWLLADEEAAAEYVGEYFGVGRRGGRVPKGVQLELVHDSPGDMEPRQIPLAAASPAVEWVRAPGSPYYLTDEEAVWHGLVRRDHVRRSMALETVCARSVGPHWEGVLAVRPPGRECLVCQQRGDEDA